MNRPHTPRNKLLVGDARSQLQALPDNAVDMVLTSPPYFRLRDYDAPGQIGLETTVEEWALTLRAVARQLHRVLVPTGSWWLNLGDSYANHPRQGAARKSLLLGPERLALQLVADGWILRNKIIWQKANPMPTSVPDRLACTWEVVYVFTTQRNAFFNLNALRVPHTSRLSKRHRVTAAVHGRSVEAWRGPNSDGVSGLLQLKVQGLVGHPLGKNPGDVWRLASSNYRGAHHATFPTALAERCITGGCPDRRCARCRAPWQRPLIRAPDGTGSLGELRATCTCDAPSEPGLVLDPFIGAGTTAVATETLQRDWLGIELNPVFAAQAAQRIAQARASPQPA
jgi:site-specific DNA-methyltransferase (adenine-specific)